MARPSVTSDDIAAYKADGAVCLRRLLDRYWIDVLNRGVDRNIAEPGPYFVDFTGADGTARCIKDDFCWERIPEYEAFARRSPCAEAVGWLMEADEVCFIEDQYFQKEAGASTPTPWHQDQSYYELAGTWCVAWIPLDPVAAEDGLRVVAGSHAGPLFTPQSFTGKGGSFDIDAEASPLPMVPDIDADPARYRVLTWAMEPGDCLVFHPRALHGNSGNRAPHRSRRLSMRWVSQTATYAKGALPWATFIPDHGLADGQRVIGDKFPLVWTRRDGLVSRAAADAAASAP
jgi:ectoine hydroxylase-related dioxygenase (phytanoyl-CoA dioxygenase family)